MYTVTVADGWGCSASDNITITVLDNTGISITELESSISIFPNPIKDLLYVDIKDNKDQIDFCIVNLEGQKVLEYIAEPYTQRKVFDFSGLNDGLYFISITMNGKVVNRKIVKL